MELSRHLDETGSSTVCRLGPVCIKFESSLPNIIFHASKLHARFGFLPELYSWFGRFTRCLPLVCIRMVGFPGEILAF